MGEWIPIVVPIKSPTIVSIIHFPIPCYEPDRGVLLPSDGLLLEAAVPKPPGRATLPGDDLGTKDSALESDASLLAAGHGGGTG